MKKEIIKIVTDSSSDIINLENALYGSAPLKIITTQKEYIDNEKLDVLNMVNELEQYKGKSSTSCPNANDWLRTFGDAKRIICFTITGTLSGCYNAACLAKQIYEESYPERQVFVVDTLSTGPEIRLMVEKTQELIDAGKSFEEICNEITEYCKKTGLIFMLESLKNLANNGRVNPIVAKAAGLLGIRIVGKASDKGELEPMDKCRGENKSLHTMVQHMKQLGLKNGKVRIAHCFNEGAAQKLKDILDTEFSNLQIRIDRCRGLCSFYAEKGGLLVGFEKM